MEKIFTKLSSCLLFDGIQTKDIETMMSCMGAITKKYDKEQTIFNEGDSAKYLGIVLSGEVKIVRMDMFGNRTILAQIDPFQMFGESFACAGVEFMPVSAVASKISEILLIDAKRITVSCCNACSFHRQVIFNLLKVVSTKNIVFNEKIEITSKRSTREKLMTFLQIQAKKNNGKSFYIPYDRQELADYLEVDRSGLSAEISKMRAEGIIESKRSFFKLID